MKAIHYRRYGGPEVLEFGELPDPKVGPDKVLVKVHAAAVNPVDWKCQAGYMDTVLDTVFPVVPGWDVSGVVVQPGVSVPEFAVGDEVMEVRPRGRPVPRHLRRVRRRPRADPGPQAARAQLRGARRRCRSSSLTAYQVITRALRLREGETLLVHAAAGGVGAMAVQLARHLGADVIGAVRESGVERVQELGARPVVYGDRFVSRVRELAPHGVQAAFDTLGGQSLKDSANVLAPEGRLASIADGDVVGLGGGTSSSAPTPTDLAALAALAERASCRSTWPGPSPWRRPQRPSGPTRRAACRARSWSRWTGPTETAPDRGRAGGTARAAVPGAFAVWVCPVRGSRRGGVRWGSRCGDARCGVRGAGPGRAVGRRAAGTRTVRPLRRPPRPAARRPARASPGVRQAGPGEPPRQQPPPVGQQPPPAAGCGSEGEDRRRGSHHHGHRERRQRQGCSPTARRPPGGAQGLGAHGPQRADPAVRHAQERRPHQQREPRPQQAADVAPSCSA